MSAAVEALVQAVLGFAQAHIMWAVPIVFALGLAEGIALISLFVPSTILFLGIGGLHSAAGGQFHQLWLAGAAGAVIGDGLSYLIGRYFKNDVHKVWPFTRMPLLLPKSREVIERWGFWSILFGKFVGGLRPFIPVVAGVMQMPLLPFAVASVISSLIWAGVFLSPGYGLALIPW